MTTKHYRQKKAGVAQRKCPARLAALLDLLNQLPEEIKLMATGGMYYQQRNIHDDLDNLPETPLVGSDVVLMNTSEYRGFCVPSNELIEEMVEVLDMLPRSDMVWPGSSSMRVEPHDPTEFVINGRQCTPLDHPEFEEAREYFLFLLDALRVCWEIAQGFTSHLSFWTRYSERHNSLRVGKDGLIQQEPSILHACLIGIEAQRIRQCKACKKLYWASRLHQRHGGSNGCSPRCNNSLRVKKWRNEHTKKTQLARAFYN